MTGFCFVKEPNTSPAAWETPLCLGSGQTSLLDTSEYICVQALIQRMRCKADFQQLEFAGTQGQLFCITAAKPASSPEALGVVLGMGIQLVSYQDIVNALRALDGIYD